MPDFTGYSFLAFLLDPLPQFVNRFNCQLMNALLAELVPLPNRFVRLAAHAAFDDVQPDAIDPFTQHLIVVPHLSRELFIHWQPVPIAE